MQRPNEEFFTLFREAGSNIIERVAIPWRRIMEQRHPR
jgi:hypothetical protein